MTDPFDLGDRIGEFLPRAIGLAPRSGGGDLAASGSSLGDAYAVVLSPSFHESFYARFEHFIEALDLEGMPLFSPAVAANDLSLEHYRQHVVLRACAIAAGDAMAGYGLVRWMQVVREIAGRLRGDPTPLCAQALPARQHLGDLRRRVLCCADFTPAFVARLRRYRPLILIGHQLLVEMRPPWDFGRVASNNDIADVALLPEPWFDRIVATIRSEFADERDDVARAEDEKFWAELAAGRAPIRGAGSLQGFAVSASPPDRLKVSLETGGPFFMEVAPGRAVLWPAAVVSVEAESSMLLGPSTNLTVRLSPCPGTHGRASGSRSNEAPSLARLASDLSLHPFASREMTFCVGSTIQRNRQLAQHTSMADVVLECHLRGAVRVFRYGWRRSNQNRVYHDLRGDPSVVGLHVVPLAEALRHVAAHPEIEMVRW
ncbi:MAG: hypothetical protein JXP73_16800 [Deltaproteobacteria bacterium]|nr:hypothetical protein [Deltaproteobacteria bacterium]